MKMTGNTILITGGGSGIGRGLAEALHALGNHVVIAGRRKDLLDGVTAANPGMESLTVDLTDSESTLAFANEAASRYPALNVLINNAGIMKAENLREPSGDLSDAESMVVTNLLAPIRLTTALLPLLKSQAEATVMMVTSGLAFMPLAMTPTYCATKAAIHSYTQSLRYQLKGTSVGVLELPPPYVQTELMGPHQATDPRAMPLGEFIAEVMQILTTQPEAVEICVQRVLPLRLAESKGPAAYAQMFEGFNASMHAD